MKGEVQILTNVWLSILSCLCYCHFISAKLPKGKFRLFSLLPIFYLFTIFPLYLTSTFNTAVTTFFITWLANFKLLLFAFDLGPLSWGPPKSLPFFITIASLPIKIEQNKDHPNKKTNKKNLSLNFAVQSLAFSLLVGMLYDDYREKLHPKILLGVYCCLVFLLIDIIIGISSALVYAMIGLELEPPSDEPYLASSLQDFWGKRWNLTVTNTLRHTVYKPVRSASAALISQDWARLLAVLASFIVSGLMHELLFYYVTRVKPTWEMTSFFVLQGVCVVLEDRIKRALSGRLRLPWWASGPLTVGFVMGSSFWLFFPPLVKNGADAKVLEEMKLFVELMKRNLKVLIFIGH